MNQNIDSFQTKMIESLKIDEGQNTSEMVRINGILKDVLTEFKEKMEDISWQNLEYIECVSRSGFIPYSNNKGGVELTGFLYSHSDAMQFTNNDEAIKTLEKSYENNLETAKEYIKTQYPNELKDWKVEDINYHGLTDKGLEDIAEKLDEAMEDDQESYKIGHEIRYQGMENDKHTFLIQSCFNWEYPYHRSGISWMPNFKTEVWFSKTIKIKNIDTLEKILENILKKLHSKL